MLEHRAPLDCRELVGLQAFDALVRERLAGADLDLLVDGLGTLCDYACPWMLRLWSQALSVRGALLAQHLERLEEEGPQLRADIRRCADLWRNRQANASEHAAMQSVLAASRSLMEAASDNPLGKITLAQSARTFADASNDPWIKHLALRVSANAFETSDPATANAFLAEANRLRPMGQSPAWLSLKVWLNVDEERSALAA